MPVPLFGARMSIFGSVVLTRAAATSTSTRAAIAVVPAATAAAAFTTVLAAWASPFHVRFS